MKVFLIFLIFIGNFINANDLKQEKLWKLLHEDNYFAMIRHAYAPGFGDPDNFDVKVKSTQRNLNETGKIQAKKIGELFRKKGITEAKVYSSHWFRCYDTAVLLDLGKVTKFKGLNSFFQDYYDEKTTSSILKDFLRNKKFDKPLILVTHQVNITNLTNHYPDSGEIIIVKKEDNNSFKVVETIPTL